MRYRCHRCNGPIAEAMSVCPWCGSKDNSFKEITRAPLICGHCERGVLPEWTACPWCYAGRFEGNGRPPRPDPQAVRHCTRRGCPGAAAPVHALLPGVQAEAGKAVEPRGPARALHALPLADLARLLPLLRLVRAAAARE